MVPDRGLRSFAARMARAGRLARIRDQFQGAVARSLQVAVGPHEDVGDGVALKDEIGIPNVHSAFGLERLWVVMGAFAVRWESPCHEREVVSDADALRCLR